MLRWWYKPNISRLFSVLELFSNIKTSAKTVCSVQAYKARRETNETKRRTMKN